jgi:signal recognition particle subunit SRP54
MDAFEEFNTQSFVSRLLGKGDVKGLMRKMEEVMPEAKQQEMMDTMAKGNMTLRGFRSLLEQIGSMGSMSSVRLRPVLVSS